MAKIAVVTDSNSGITQREAAELGVFVLPMPFDIDGKEYFEDIPASRNIRGINHGLIKTTTDDIGFTAPRKI